ncbi:MAG: PAS domain S-box protein, partial [Terriglobia bacterium]
MQQLLKALNSLSHPLAMLRLPEYRYAFASEGFLRLCGRQREEVIGKTEQELRFFAESQVQDRLRSATPSRSCVSIAEFTFRMQSGEERRGFLTLDIIEIEDVNHLVVSVQDITEQKRTEKVLHDTEELYHAVAEQGWEGILLVDFTSKKILQATRSFLQLLGYSHSEIVRFTLHNLIAREREAIDSDMNQISMGQLYSVGERPFLRKDHQVIDLEVSANPVYYRGSLALRLVVRDVG